MPEPSFFTVGPGGANPVGQVSRQSRGVPEDSGARAFQGKRPCRKEEFTPETWQFPPGSSIGPGEYLIVWADADGGLCPRPAEVLPGDGQLCPEPTNPPLSQYHTSFRLERNGDELYLFDTAETGFGVIHGVEFGPQAANTSLSLIPDGDRNGSFVRNAEPTPGEPNRGPPEPSFIRGDADAQCAVDITDAIFVLSHLFQGGLAPACPDAADTDDSGGLELTDAVFVLNNLFHGGDSPPLPGVDVPGPDPTPDELGPCVPPSCP